MDDRRGHAACDHQQHADERRAGEARNHQAEHVDARAGRRAHAQDHEPEEAAEPDGGGGDVRPVEHERERRGRRLRRVPGQAGDGRRRPGGEKRAGQGEERGHRPLPATAVVDPEERPGREAEQHEHDLEVGERPAQVGVADDRHRGGEVEERALGELRRRDEDVEGDRNQRHGERDRRRQRERPQRHAGDRRRRPGDDRPQREQADGDHHAQEDEPAGDDQLRRRRGLRERRNDELRRRPGVGPDGEGKRPADGMAVGRDHPPVDEVPALRQVPHRHLDRVRVRRQRGGRAARLLLAPGVRHRDHGELRRDRLVVGEADPGRRRRHGAAGLGVGAQERGVRPRRLRQRERACRDGEGEPCPAHPAAHVSGLRPAARPIAPSRTPTAPITSAAMTSSVLAPPPSDDPSTTGLGVSDDSGPFQSTTVPSE